MSEAGPQMNGPASPTGKFIETIDPEDPAYIKNLQRPAEVKEDLQQMENRSRVSMVLNSQAFKEELEQVVEEQLRSGPYPASLLALQQITDLLLPHSRGTLGSLSRAQTVIPINDLRGVESLGFAKGEKLLRCKLASLYRLIDLCGWTHGIYNHISARVNSEDEHFLINPFGMLYSEITASSLCKVDVQGQVIEPGSSPLGFSKAGFTLHAAIHQARPDIRCVVHLHTPAVVAVSAMKCGLLPLSQEALICGNISYHEYQGIFIDENEKEKLARNLGVHNKVLMLRNHGVAVCGETIEEAFHFVFNLMAACETQVKVIPAGIDNLLLASDEAKEHAFRTANQGGGGVDTSGRKWRLGEMEFEALMRSLDNAGYRTGYVYKLPMVKSEKKDRSNSEVEIPPASSSFTYIFDGDYEHSKYPSPLRAAMERQKKAYKAGWLTTPNTYKKQEVEEIGTTTPKKITKWVSDGESPNRQGGMATKVENPNQFAPQGDNPKEFKQKQKSIKKDYYEEKVTAGPQSKILEGMTWEEAQQAKDGQLSGAGDQVIVLGAASKGIIQRDHQHNAVVYRQYYAANPFENMSEADIEKYQSEVQRKERGEPVEEVQVPTILTEPEAPPTQPEQPDTEVGAVETQDSNGLGETLPSQTGPREEDFLARLADQVVQTVIRDALAVVGQGKGQQTQSGFQPPHKEFSPNSQEHSLGSQTVADFRDFLVNEALFRAYHRLERENYFENMGREGEEQRDQNHNVAFVSEQSAMYKSVSREDGAAGMSTDPSSPMGASDSSGLITIQLNPIQLYHGQQESGVMRVKFSIQSTVRRRVKAEITRSASIEEIYAAITEPVIQHVYTEPVTLQTTEQKTVGPEQHVTTHVRKSKRRKKKTRRPVPNVDQNLGLPADAEVEDKENKAPVGSNQVSIEPDTNTDRSDKAKEPVLIENAEITWADSEEGTDNIIPESNKELEDGEVAISSQEADKKEVHIMPAEQQCKEVVSTTRVIEQDEANAEEQTERHRSLITEMEDQTIPTILISPPAPFANPPDYETENQTKVPSIQSLEDDLKFADEDGADTQPPVTLAKNVTTNRPKQVGRRNMPPPPLPPVIQPRYKKSKKRRSQGRMKRTPLSPVKEEFDGTPQLEAMDSIREETDDSFEKLLVSAEEDVLGNASLDQMEDGLDLDDFIGVVPIASEDDFELDVYTEPDPSDISQDNQRQDLQSAQANVRPSDLNFNNFSDQRVLKDKEDEDDSDELDSSDELKEFSESLGALSSEDESDYDSAPDVSQEERSMSASPEVTLTVQATPEQSLPNTSTPTESPDVTSPVKAVKMYHEIDETFLPETRDTQQLKNTETLIDFVPPQDEKQVKKNCEEEEIEISSSDELEHSHLKQATISSKEKETIDFIVRKEATKEKETIIDFNPPKEKETIIDFNPPKEKETIIDFNPPKEKETTIDFIPPKEKGTVIDFIPPKEKETTIDFNPLKEKETIIDFIPPKEKETIIDFNPLKEKETIIDFIPPKEKETIIDFNPLKEKETIIDFIPPKEKETIIDFNPPKEKETIIDFNPPKEKGTVIDFIPPKEKETTIDFNPLKEKETIIDFIPPKEKETIIDYNPPKEKETTIDFIPPKKKGTVIDFIPPKEKETIIDFIPLKEKETTIDFIPTKEKETTIDFIPPKKKGTVIDFIPPKEKETIIDFIPLKEKETTIDFIPTKEKETIIDFIPPKEKETIDFIPPKEKETVIDFIPSKEKEKIIDLIPPKVIEIVKDSASVKQEVDISNVLSREKKTTISLSQGKETYIDAFLLNEKESVIGSISPQEKDIARHSIPSQVKMMNRSFDESSTESSSTQETESSTDFPPPLEEDTDSPSSVENDTDFPPPPPLLEEKEETEDSVAYMDDMPTPPVKNEAEEILPKMKQSRVSSYSQATKETCIDDVISHSQSETISKQLPSLAKTFPPLPSMTKETNIDDSSSTDLDSSADRFTDKPEKESLGLRESAQKKIRSKPLDKPLLVADEGPIGTSSPKMGRRKFKESPFKTYPQKLGKSEETLLEILPFREPQSKYFPAKSHEGLEGSSDKNELLKSPLSRTSSLGPHHKKREKQGPLAFVASTRSKETLIDDAPNSPGRENRKTILDQYHLMKHNEMMELSSARSVFKPPVVTVYPVTSEPLPPLPDTTDVPSISDTEGRERSLEEAKRSRMSAQKIEASAATGEMAKSEGSPRRSWVPKQRRERRSHRLSSEISEPTVESSHSVTVESPEPERATSRTGSWVRRGREGNTSRDTETHKDSTKSDESENRLTQPTNGDDGETASSNVKQKNRRQKKDREKERTVEDQSTERKKVLEKKSGLDKDVRREEKLEHSSAGEDLKSEDNQRRWQRKDNTRRSDRESRRHSGRGKTTEHADQSTRESLSKTDDVESIHSKAITNKGVQDDSRNKRESRKVVEENNENRKKEEIDSEDRHRRSDTKQQEKHLEETVDRDDGYEAKRDRSGRLEYSERNERREAEDRRSGRWEDRRERRDDSGRRQDDGMRTDDTDRRHVIQAVDPQSQTPAPQVSQSRPQQGRWRDQRHTVPRGRQFDLRGHRHRDYHERDRRESLERAKADIARLEALHMEEMFGDEAMKSPVSHGHGVEVVDLSPENMHLSAVKTVDVQSSPRLSRRRGGAIAPRDEEDKRKANLYGALGKDPKEIPRKDDGLLKVQRLGDDLNGSKSNISLASSGFSRRSTSSSPRRRSRRSGEGRKPQIDPYTGEPYYFYHPLMAKSVESLRSIGHSSQYGSSVGEISPSKSNDLTMSPQIKESAAELADSPIAKKDVKVVEGELMKELSSKLETRSFKDQKVSDQQRGLSNEKKVNTDENNSNRKGKELEGPRQESNDKGYNDRDEMQKEELGENERRHQKRRGSGRDEKDEWRRKDSSERRNKDRSIDEEDSRHRHQLEDKRRRESDREERDDWRKKDSGERINKEKGLAADDEPTSKKSDDRREVDDYDEKKRREKDRDDERDAQRRSSDKKRSDRVASEDRRRDSHKRRSKDRDFDDDYDSDHRRRRSDDKKREDREDRRRDSHKRRSKDRDFDDDYDSDHRKRRSDDKKREDREERRRDSHKRRSKDRDFDDDFDSDHRRRRSDDRKRRERDRNERDVTRRKDSMEKINKDKGLDDDEDSGRDRKRDRNDRDSDRRHDSARRSKDQNKERESDSKQRKWIDKDDKDESKDEDQNERKQGEVDADDDSKNVRRKKSSERKKRDLEDKDSKNKDFQEDDEKLGDKEKRKEKEKEDDDNNDDDRDETKERRSFRKWLKLDIGQNKQEDPEKKKDEIKTAVLKKGRKSNVRKENESRGAAEALGFSMLDNPLEVGYEPEKEIKPQEDVPPELPPKKGLLSRLSCVGSQSSDLARQKSKGKAPMEKKGKDYYEEGEKRKIKKLSKDKDELKDVYFNKEEAASGDEDDERKKGDTDSSLDRKEEPSSVPEEYSTFEPAEVRRSRRRYNKKVESSTSPPSTLHSFTDPIKVPDLKQYDEPETSFSADVLARIAEEESLSSFRLSDHSKPSTFKSFGKTGPEQPVDEKKHGDDYNEETKNKRLDEKKEKPVDDIKEDRKGKDVDNWSFKRQSDEEKLRPFDGTQVDRREKNFDSRTSKGRSDEREKHDTKEERRDKGYVKKTSKRRSAEPDDKERKRDDGIAKRSSDLQSDCPHEGHNRLEDKDRKKGNDCDMENKNIPYKQSSEHKDQVNESTKDLVELREKLSNKQWQPREKRDRASRPVTRSSISQDRTDDDQKGEKVNQAKLSDDNVKEKDKIVKEQDDNSEDSLEQPNPQEKKSSIHAEHTDDDDSSSDHSNHFLNSSAPAYFSESQRLVFGPSHDHDSFTDSRHINDLSFDPSASFDMTDVAIQRRNRAVSFDGEFAPSLPHPHLYTKNRRISQTSFADTNSQPSHSRPRSSSTTSNPMMYQPWRTKARRRSRSMSISDMVGGKPRRSHSIGEIYNSTVASSVARRRSRTSSSGDVLSRMYQPRQRSRSRASLGDTTLGSAAPKGQTQHESSPVEAPRHSAHHAEPAVAPVKRSESERQPSRNPQLVEESDRKNVERSKSDRRAQLREELGEDKPASPSKSDTLRSTDSASGGETLEERSSKEGSPTKEHPSPTKDKKKKKKFRIPSFSKKKKESKESSM